MDQSDSGGPPGYLAAEEYTEIVEMLNRVSTVILFAIARSSEATRDTIIRNFIARSAVCLDSILRLWAHGRYSDCWALHRLLVDRLFHLHALEAKGDWQEFSDWTFIRQYEANHRALSDELMGAKARATIQQPKPEVEARYQAVKARAPKWVRPRAEDVAKELGMPFLYRFAYDYGSTQVHPMATDGEEEFLILTGFNPQGYGVDRRLLLSNSVLLHTMVLQQGLSASGLKWRTILFDFLGHVRAALGGDKEFRRSFAKIASAGPDFQWCQQSSLAG